MNIWLIISILLVMAVLYFLFRNQNQESFADFSRIQTDFTDQQYSYFNLANKIIPVNKDLALNPISVNKALHILGTPPSFNISQIFEPEDNSFQERDFKFCRNAVHPRNLQRPPKASIGCGWWYVENPNGLSLGALGRLEGPIDKNLVEQNRGGRWIWSLDEAAKLEDVKKCKRIKSCDVMDAPGIKNECGFCADLGYAIPIDSAGNPKYPNDDSLLCPGTVVTSTNQCPRQAFQIVDAEEDINLEYSDDGIPITTSRRTAAAEAVIVRGTCDPDARGRLSRDCMITLGKSVGMSEGGAVLKAIRSGNKLISTEDRYAVKYVSEGLQIVIPEQIFTTGSIDKTSVTNIFALIVENMRNPNRRISEAAKYLAIGNPDFNICMFEDNDTGPFPAECLQREFRKAGCQPAGEMAPNEKNASVYSGLSLSRIRKEFKDVFDAMKTSKTQTDQNKAMMNCLGTELYKPKPPVCDEPGIEYLIYSSNDGTTSNVFLARYISRNGLEGETGTSTFPWESAGSALRKLVEQFTATNKVMVMRTFASVNQDTSMRIGADFMLKDGKGLNNLILNGNEQPRRVIRSSGTINGEQFNKVEWPFTLRGKDRNKIEFITSGTRITYPNEWEYAKLNLETFQLQQESWRPIVSLDFFKGRIADSNDVVKLKHNEHVVLDELAGKRCALFLRRQGKIKWEQGIHSRNFVTMTFMVYMISSPGIGSFLSAVTGSTPHNVSLYPYGNHASVIFMGPYCAAALNTPASNYLNKWVHLAVTFDYSSSKPTITAYINGQKQELYSGYTPPSNYSTGILNNISCGDYLEGGISWIHVYDYKLTPQQIVRDMNYDNPTYEMKDIPLPEVNLVSCKYTNYPGKDMPGNDFSSDTAANLSECVNRCCDEKQCVGYQYNASNKMCFLKNRVTFAVDSIPQANTGILPDKAVMLERPGVGTMVDVRGVSKNNGERVHMWSNWNGPNQQWYMNSSGELKSVNSGMCLDALGFANNNGADVAQWRCNGYTNQQWILDSKQRLHPAHAPDMCLDDNSNYANGPNGGKVSLWQCHDGANQKWNIKAAQ